MSREALEATVLRTLRDRLRLADAEHVHAEICRQLTDEPNQRIVVRSASGFVFARVIQGTLGIYRGARDDRDRTRDYIVGPVADLAA